MISALFRWAKAVGYLLTGQLDSARRTLDTNPHVMRAKYDEVIRDKTDRIHQYKQAVAGLIAQQENKIAKVKTLTAETTKLEDLKSGALAKAKQRVAQLQAQGKTEQDIKSDEEYMKCLAAYNDFSSTLLEKQAHIVELETDVKTYLDKIKDHKIQLQHLVREIDTLKAEAADAVAEIITAKQEKEIADAFSGLAEDGTEKELQRMRELRQEVKAEARISREMAGTDTRAQEAEFMEYARSTVANDEFDSLVGLAAKTDSAAKEEKSPSAEKKSSLPE
jgi:chromosome segregation ATPase